MTIPTPVRLAASALAVTLAALVVPGCESRSYNSGAAAAKKKTAEPGEGGALPEELTKEQLDAILGMMEENRRRFWARSVLRDFPGEEDKGTKEYFDNESEKVDWAGVRQCIGNDSRSASGAPLSDLAHHYYCTLPGYLPAKRAAEPGEERSSSALYRDRAWRVATAKTERRMWLHTGIRACFTFSLRGETLDKDEARTEFLKRGPIEVPDKDNPGVTRTLSPVEHAFLYCLHDGRAANPDELDAAKREQIQLSYLSGKTAADLPKPFAFVARTQADLFKLAMAPRKTTPAIQKRLNAFYGIPAKPKKEDCAKRPLRDDSLEVQDGTHCLVGL